MNSYEDKYFFVNKFLVLILVLGSLVFGLLGLTTLIAVALKDYKSFSKVANGLSDVGTFLGGAAAIVAAGIALRGFDTWKRQLKYGKNLEVIWDALEQLRRTHNAYLKWYSASRAAASAVSYEGPSINHKTTLDESLLLLEQHFNRLDLLVFRKNDPKLNHEWNNYGSDIRRLVERSNHTFNNFKPRQTKRNPYSFDPAPLLNFATSGFTIVPKSETIHTTQELDSTQLGINKKLDQYWFSLDEKLTAQEKAYI